MQREIEALLKAYLEGRSYEARLVQDVLTALAVGSAARQQMIQEMAAAVGQVTAQPTPTERVGVAQIADDVSVAINQMRAARGASVNH